MGGKEKMIITDKVDIGGSGIQPADRTKGQTTAGPVGGVAPRTRFCFLTRQRK